VRTIDRSSAFNRDYKREAKGQHHATLDDALKPVLVALATDQPLDARTANFSVDASRRGGPQRACQSEAAGAIRCQAVDITRLPGQAPPFLSCVTISRLIFFICWND